MRQGCAGLGAVKKVAQNAETLNLPAANSRKAAHSGLFSHFVRAFRARFATFLTAPERSGARSSPAPRAGRRPD